MFQKNLFHHILSRRILKSFLRGLPCTVLALVRGLLVASFSVLLVAAIVYAWTEPTQAPPGGNVAAPLNVGPNSQYKSGALGIGGVFRGYSNAVFDGSVGIGTTGPGAKLELAGDNDITKIRLNYVPALYPTTYLADIWYDGGVSFTGLALQSTESAANNGKILLNPYGGNVGIGTTDPAGAKLRVAGDVKWTGSLLEGSVPWPRLTSFPSACPSGQYVSGVGSGLACSTPPGTGGDITGVWGGSGLTGGAASGEVTLDVGAGTGISVGADAVSVKNISFACGAANQSLKSINIDNGTITCETDDTGLTSESDPVWVSWRDNQNRNLSGNLWIGGTVIASGWFASPYNTNLTVDAGWGSPNTLTLYDTVQIPNGSLTVSAPSGTRIASFNDGAGPCCAGYYTISINEGYGNNQPTLQFHDAGVAEGQIILQNDIGGGQRGFRFQSVQTSMGGRFTGNLLVSDGQLALNGNSAQSDTANTIAVQNQTGWMSINSPNGLYLQNMNDKNLILTSGGGRIGIGTTGPNAKLDVQGGNVLIGPTPNEGNRLEVGGNLATFGTLIVKPVQGGLGEAYININPRAGGGRGSLDIQGTDNMVVSAMYRGPEDNDRAFQVWKCTSGAPQCLSGNAIFIVERDGDVRAKGGFSGGQGYMDLAEYMPALENLESGDVVVFDEATGKLRRSFRAYDFLAAGVISTKPGFVLGADDEEFDWGEKDLGDSLAANLLEEIIKTEKKTQKAALALSGRVPAKVDATREAIKIGDLLVTSNTPGYAMKADPDKIKEGMVIGKALQSLEKGKKGVILILVK